VNDRNDAGELDLGVVNDVAFVADDVGPPAVGIFVYRAAPRA
jgi:hypothetical protein